MRNNKEQQINKLITETVNKILNESDWRTADNTTHKANYVYDYDMLADNFDDFEESARNLMQTLYKSPKGIDLAKQLELFLIDAGKFCKRKTKQAASLDQHAKDSFKKKFGKTKAEMDTHIIDLYHKHGSDNMDDDDWRNNNLSPEENEYYNNN